MDAEKIRRVLKICMDAYEYINSLGESRNKERMEALESFRTDSRKYPALIAKEGLFTPLLDLLKDCVEKRNDQPPFVKHKKVYSWVVMRVLYEVVLEDERLAKLTRISCHRQGDGSNGKPVLCVDHIIRWLIGLAPDKDEPASERLVETNFLNEHLAKQLVDYLVIVKKFAEAMIPPKEARGGVS